MYKTNVVRGRRRAVRVHETRRNDRRSDYHDGLAGYCQPLFAGFPRGLAWPGLVGAAGEVGLYAGDAGEYFGDVGE